MSPPHLDTKQNQAEDKQLPASKIICKIFPSLRNFSPQNRHLASVNNLILATVETSLLFVFL